MAQHISKDDHNRQSLQSNEHNFKTGECNNNLEDIAHRPRIQSSRHNRMSQNFENRELQQSKATSFGSSYRRRKKGQEWNYEAFCEAKKNNGSEGQPRTKGRPVPRNPNRVASNDQELQLADVSSSVQGLVLSDDLKCGDQVVACVDGQTGKSCTADTTKSHKKWYKNYGKRFQWNQTRDAGGRSRAGHNEANCAANEAKAEMVESENVQGDKVKDDRNETEGKNEASGPAGRALAKASFDGDRRSDIMNKVRYAAGQEGTDDNEGKQSTGQKRLSYNEAHPPAGKLKADKDKRWSYSETHSPIGKDEKWNYSEPQSQTVKDERWGYSETHPPTDKLKAGKNQRWGYSETHPPTDKLEAGKNQRWGYSETHPPTDKLEAGKNQRWGYSDAHSPSDKLKAEKDERSGYSDAHSPTDKLKAEKDERSGYSETHSPTDELKAGKSQRWGYSETHPPTDKLKAGKNQRWGYSETHPPTDKLKAGKNQRWGYSETHPPTDKLKAEKDERSGYSDAHSPTDKLKAGKNEARLDGKTGSNSRQFSCRSSNSEARFQDGQSSANKNKIKRKENDNFKTVKQEESSDVKNDDRNMLVTSSDILDKKVQTSACEANSGSFADKGDKQLEENDGLCATHRKRRMQRPNQNLSRYGRDDRTQTKTKTDCRPVLIYNSTRTTQNLLRGSEKWRPSERLEDLEFPGKESQNLKPFVAVAFTETCPVKNRDKANMAEYLTRKTGMKLNKAEVVVKSDGEKGQLMVHVYFLTDDPAMTLTSRINSLAPEDSLRATFYSVGDAWIEHAWSKIMTEAESQIEKHQVKSLEVKKQLSELEGETAKKKWINIDEHKRRLEIRGPLKKKICELEKQEQEFCKYLDQLKKEIDNIKGESRPKSRVNFLRSEFSLELKRFETALPLYARKSDIIDTVLTNSVSIILGETGSGKSTQMLQYLYEAELFKDGFVVCTQPRKVAALSLARYVAQEMRCKVGDLVGFHVGSKHCQGPDTRLIYVTDHALLNECLQDATFKKYSCIVIDEAHERSIYTDLLLGFVKKALVVRKDLKVVITSATIDPEVFVRYFSVGNFVPPVLKISGRTFPVDVYYQEPAEDYVMAACKRALEVHRTEPPGDVLVFLSSPIETEKACRWFQSQVATGEAVALELHGRLRVEDQQKVFEVLLPGKRKVVFATNCAETSITIPGIKYVIDAGQMKEVSYDPSKNMSAVQLTLITKSSAEQRKGRAGRTDCGKCFRLYTEEQYTHDMRPVSVPEILRIHLGQALLKLASLGMRNPLDFEFVESPSVVAIESAMSVLRELDAYGDTGITDFGQKLAKIALEPRLGKAVLLGLEQKIAYEALVMAVVASFGGNVFFRVGTDEQKKQADKRKTRFCDQWGDIVTLVNVYKEWEGLPPGKQGAWCLENCINSKSMKMARDLLTETLQTVKRDLKVIIQRRWSGDADLNYRLAKIIFDCYSSNLCRFSGHRRGGYYLARLPDVSLQLHPSSAFNYMEDFPRWVVYEQVLTTSRSFMQNTTYVDESWIREKIANGRLPDGLLDALDRYLLEPCIITGVGASCMNRLLSGKALEVKQLENSLKELLDDEGEKVFIDLSPSNGTIVVYATKLLKELSVAAINSLVAAIRKSLQDESIEQPIRAGASVHVILEKGAKIRTILMPYESRQVKISRISDEFADTGKVKQLLSVYGEIETVKLLDERKDLQGEDQREMWGFVTFKFPEPARKLLEDAAFFPFQVEIQKQALQTVNRIEDFKVKVKVCRRRQRDFGFVKFQDAYHATLAGATLNSIRIEGRSMSYPGHFLNDEIFHFHNFSHTIQLVSVTPDISNSRQLYLKRIPQWADKEMILDALAKALDPELVIEEVTIARERPPPALLSAALFAEFCQAIRSKLWINGNLWEFHLQAKPPTEKAFCMTAYVAFTHAHQAQVARDLLNGSLIVGSQAVAVVELRTSVFVSGPIFRLLGAEIIAETEAAVHDSGGGLKIQITERRNGGHSIQLEATSLDCLKQGKARIDGVINGLEMNLDLRRFSRLKSSDGKRFQELLQRETQTMLRLDERRQAVFVHGSRTSAEEAKDRLFKFISTDFPERVVDIPLRGSGCPSGLMKALVIKYGSNLERLKDLSGATTVELLLRKHVIQVQGSDESLQRLKELIEEEASKIPGRDAAVKSSMPDCPVCLVPIDSESCYILEYCGHSYCKECALSLIENGLENNEIPIQCAAEGCCQDVTIRDLRNLPVNIRKVFDTAIRAFVQTNSTEFGYCITADCPVVYRKARQSEIGEMFQCSECQMKLCTACASEFHHGMTCEVYRCLQGDDNDIKTWLTERPNDRSLCPQCKMGIEKNGGCMHVECTVCHAHICWRCKRMFPSSAQCYNHLAKCGGIFGNENFGL